MDIQDINLVRTCRVCPEQYDAKDTDGNCIAYLRLRHGAFTVECPDIGGECVYYAEPRGDGVFEDDEREIHLNAAKQAIVQYYNRINKEAHSADMLLWGTLLKHRGHTVNIVSYGDFNNPVDVCLECEDCGEVILDADIYTICARTDETE